MTFNETPLKGAYFLDPERAEDDRGFFARVWCQREFEAHGLKSNLVQCSVSFNRRKGTLRGMHYQAAPHAETKLVRCTAGAIYDVIVDLRPDSPSHKKWIGVELSAANRRMLYIPEGFAHGFQTLEDNTEVYYQMSEFFHPESVRGWRWNDPAFAIRWPLPDPMLSARDKNHVAFSDIAA